jgi:membrane glycosyltransferase
MSAIEVALAAMIGFTNLLITFYALTALAGLWPARAESTSPGRGLDIALLMLTYNEVPEPVFARAQAMREALSARPGAHRFRFYILSDTRDPEIAAREEALHARLYDEGRKLPLYYRRREENTDRKIGNLQDWMSRWGAAHEAMLVLDADSLMAPEAVVALADCMAADPALGLAQSAPGLIGGTSRFARLQSFATSAYGPPLSRGLARWTGASGNFWGHNALLRLPAFAQCALLPRLGRGKRLILSHDFVEAALMRRAGWAVRFFPETPGSYEAPPPGIVEWVLRDRRWIAGNLQHLRLLGIKGLAPLSRLHFALGAAAYLMSPAWLIVLAIWALLGNGADQSVIAYFSAENPLYPVWPETGPLGPDAILGLTMAALIAPKLLALVPIALSRVARRGYGGLGRLMLSCAVELIGTALIAPILMVQQSRAVIAIALGRKIDWQPPNREGGGHALAGLFRFHWLETLAGAALFAGVAAGLVTPWLLPIAASLAFAAPLSLWMGRKAGRRQFATPEITEPPAIWQAAQAWRARLSEEPEQRMLAAE